jgi:crotonobetainyl-CoA:carnitine CoA-transferase CaiB-like acyl-CoA transferase
MGSAPVADSPDSTDRAAVFSDLIVVEFGQGMAVPMAGQVFADNGAHVTKVERPTGDWARSFPGFEMWNRGKGSVVLNLADPMGRTRAQDLCGGADVVISDLSATTAKAAGVADEDLRVANPRLVHCIVDAYGRWFPDQPRQGYESIVAARIGRMFGNDVLSGAHPQTSATDPVFPLAPVGSYGAAMLAVEGIIGALIAREQTGSGDLVTTSLVDGFTATTMRLQFRRDGADVVPVSESPRDLQFQGIALCFLVVECSDGRFIQMCARQDDHFRRWLGALGLDHRLGEDRYRGAPMAFGSVEDLDELKGEIRRRMRTLTQLEWMQRFKEQDVPADPFLSTSEFLRHPQMLASNRIVELQSAAGAPLRQVGALALFSEARSTIASPAPPLGQGSARRPGWSSGSSGSTSDGPVQSETAAALSASGPLTGVTLLEFGYFLAGPQASTLLAELGARVIKIEPLAGDPFRRVGLEALHVTHGKKSLALDLKAPEAKEIVRRLVAFADGVVVSFRGGVSERLGLDYESLRATNPSLVYLSATAYGKTGPDAARAAFHSTPNSLCGAGILQGGVGNPPVDDSYPDPCSALAGAVALAMGLYDRRRRGRGQMVETTMLASAGYVLSNRLVEGTDHPEPEANDRHQHGSNPFSHLYECSEGWVVVALHQAVEWDRFVNAIGVPGLNGLSLEAARSPDRAAAIAEMLTARFRQDTAEGWEAALTSAHVPCAVVNPAAIERVLASSGRMAPATDVLLGEYWRLPPRVTYATLGSTLGPACRPGEHTDVILSELGYTPDEVQILLDRGVLGRARAFDPTCATAVPV